MSLDITPTLHQLNRFRDAIYLEHNNGQLNWRDLIAQAATRACPHNNATTDDDVGHMKSTIHLIESEVGPESGDALKDLSEATLELIEESRSAVERNDKAAIIDASITAQMILEDLESLGESTVWTEDIL